MIKMKPIYWGISLEEYMKGINKIRKKEDNKSKITAPNKSVYAAPAYGGLGLHSARSVA
jgi:hypothetical protein